MFTEHKISFNLPIRNVLQIVGKDDKNRASAKKILEMRSYQPDI